jgi:hypothetical protein
VGLKSLNSLKQLETGYASGTARCDSLEEPKGWMEYGHNISLVEDSILPQILNPLESQEHCLELYSARCGESVISTCLTFLFA